MTRTGKLKRYNSGIDNVHSRLTDRKGGKNARLKYYELTKNPVFKESNFQKVVKTGKGKSITIKEVKSAFKQIRTMKEKSLKADWKELKKENTSELKVLRKELKKEKSKKHKNKDKIDKLKGDIKIKKDSLSNQKDFVIDNLHDDLEFEDIRELFNSP